LTSNIVTALPLIAKQNQHLGSTMFEAAIVKNIFAQKNTIDIDS